MRDWEVDRDRLAGQFNRLVVSLQPEIVLRHAAVPKNMRRVVRAPPLRLVEIFKAFVEFPAKHVVESQLARGVRVGRVEGERALVFDDSLLGAPLCPKDVALHVMRPGPIRIKGERLRLQLVGSFEVALWIAGKAKRRWQVELDPQVHQGGDIVGIDGERPFAERKCRIRRIADKSCLPHVV
jgi:hypothetical protein